MIPRVGFPFRPFALSIALASTLAGCGDGNDGSSGPDGGGRDANILDSAFVDGSSMTDAGAPSTDAAGGKDADVCTTTPCDPLEGSCQEPLLTCVLTGLEPTCEEKQALLPGDLGEPCETPLDCRPGLACFRRRDAGICAQVCCPGDNSVCSSEEDRCGGTGVLVDGSATNWGQCVGLRPCSVLNPEKQCEPGEGCYIVSPEGATDCLLAGRGQLGDPCEAANDCEGGLFCGGLTSPGSCQRICDLSDDPVVTCAPEEGTCVAYSHSPAGSGLCTP